MAKFRVSAPDGSTWEVNAPDGADEAAVMEYAKSQWKPKQEAAPAEDPGFLQSALIGAGRTLDRLGKGAKQMALNVASPFSQGARDELGSMAQQEAENTRLYSKLQEIRPGATFLGEAAPLLAAPVFGGGITALAASAALPGLVEYGTPGEKLQRASMGAAGGTVGGVAAKGFARLLKPTQSVPAAQSAASDAADRLGVKLTAGEASGNKAMRWAEAASADMPIASGIASRRVASNDRAISQAATRAIGQQADEVTPTVLAAARDAISSEYDRILKPLQVNLDKSFQTEVKAITGSKVMKALRNEETDAIIAPFQNLPQGRIKVSGEWFQQNKTALDDAIRSAYNSGEPGKARALERFEAALDRAAKRSMSTADRDAYDLARKQWANLRMLETGKVVDDGKVMPGRLKSAMESRYKQAFKEGKIKGELTDISSLAGVLRQPPQSGTTPRAIYSGALGGAALVDPIMAAKMVAAPTLLQGVAASPAMRKYMTEGLVNVTPEMEKLLSSLGGRAGLLGVYGASQ